MDPASVLAFVLVGLKSAKAAHKILSSYKDGPETVKKAKSDVEGLLQILEQLSKCRALEGDGDEALRAPIEACLRDIESFASKLRSLDPEASKSPWGKYRKRFKAMLDGLCGH
ncbi:hypothetical protein C8A00DRAFT_17414 [Chaetomidium leptoderma]|uniref:Azaphilone pigments biosynthesis cluster protein L N-terminal domain-containing protein n=1 Tax=Chaetomidium leptoderma TaxID=669021 RepID=A0AAN6VJ69_9PEZI|nr:hypothetical protein C8A00DRAFT_17414 [Chaetomidium leptoderma]